MSEHVICLGCGGMVDEGEGVPDGALGCQCPPPEVAVNTVQCPSCGGSLRVGARACPYCHCTLATRRCPSCTAWNLSEARHCQACGRMLDDRAHENADVSERNCPRCGGPLHARQYGDFDVDECDSCGGLLVTPTTMDRIVSARDAPTNLQLALPERPYQRETEVRYLRCPTCENMMNRKAFGRISGVVVDVCKNHGVWFDAGELAQVLAFIDRGGLQRARERAAEELEEVRRRAKTQERREAITRSVPTQAEALARQSQRRAGAIDFGLAGEFVRALASLWS